MITCPRKKRSNASLAISQSLTLQTKKQRKANDNILIMFHLPRNAQLHLFEAFLSQQISEMDRECVNGTKSELWRSNQASLSVRLEFWLYITTTNFEQKSGTIQDVRRSLWISLIGILGLKSKCKRNLHPVYLKLSQDATSLQYQARILAKHHQVPFQENHVRPERLSPPFLRVDSHAMLHSFVT